MENKMELFERVAKCDICGLETTVAAMGPHVIHSHLRDIDSKILPLIRVKGTTIEDVMAKTGFSRERVRNRFRNFARQGRIRLVRRNNQYIAYAPSKAVKVKTEPKVQESISNNAEQGRGTDVLESLMDRIHRQADEILREKYKEEYNELLNTRIMNIVVNIGRG